MNYELSNDDDVFNEFIKTQEEAEKAAKNKKGNFQGVDYDDIKYVGLSKDHPTIVRFVGNFQAPGGHRKHPTDMKELFITKIKGDDGKTMFLYLPLRDDDADRDHLMWKIIDTVMRKEWVKDPSTGKNRPVEVVKVSHPDIYELVAKGGYTEADGKWPYLYAKGWKGTQMLLINCIDRMDSWCKDNKHTKLLSKKVEVTPDGKEWADMGIPSYGFLSTLIGVRQNFGSWEKYDCVITKQGTGLDTKTNIFNGTVSTSPAAIDAKVDKAMGIDSSYYKHISQDNSLTTEELNYERYDLDKNFKVTSYHQINKRLSKSIKKIDAALGTTFYDKLQELVEEETQLWEAQKTKEEDELVAKAVAQAEAERQAEQEITSQEVQEPKNWGINEEPVNEPAATPSRRVVAESTSKSALTPEKIALLKGWDSLTDDEKSVIEDIVVKADGTLDHVVYSESAGALLKCETADGRGCSFESPSTFSSCPCCGAKYA